MRRLLLALFLAILIHVAVLGLEISPLLDNRVISTEPMTVTVTMSYRRIDPEPEEEEIREKEIEIQEKKAEALPVDPAPAPSPDVPKAPDLDEAPQLEAKSDANEEPFETIEELTHEIISHGDEIKTKRTEEEDIHVEEAVHEAVPLYKMNPAPDYPRAAMKRGYEGTVILSVLVNENGRVDNIWVFESSGYNMLDNAAVKAVKDWIFEPGMKGSKKVEMWVRVPVMFNLE